MLLYKTKLLLPCLNSVIGYTFVDKARDPDTIRSPDSIQFNFEIAGILHDPKTLFVAGDSCKGVLSAFSKDSFVAKPISKYFVMALQV